MNEIDTHDTRMILITINPFYSIYIFYIYIYIDIRVNYNDLTATSLESWLVREIIPKWPKISG